MRKGDMLLDPSLRIDFKANPDKIAKTNAKKIQSANHGHFLSMKNPTVRCIQKLHLLEERTAQLLGSRTARIG